MADAADTAAAVAIEGEQELREPALPLWKDAQLTCAMLCLVTT